MKAFRRLLKNKIKVQFLLAGDSGAGLPDFSYQQNTKKWKIYTK
jgi:hypothetical protein